MAVAESITPGEARKGRSQQKRPRRASPARARGKSNSHRLPGWKDLAGSNERSRVASRRNSFLERVSTTRFALLVVGMAVLFTLYVGHVHATQDMLAEVQQERRDNLRLHLKFNRLKGDFDQMVGPSVIYTRASELGLVEDPSFGPTIHVGE